MNASSAVRVAVKLQLPVFSPGALSALKWLALVLMVGDHVDAALFGRSLGWPSLLGRLVFPIFAFVLAYNLARPGALQTGVYGRTFWRLVGFGVVAMPAHAWLFSQAGGWWPLNVLWTFAAFVAIAYAVDVGDRWHQVLAILLFGLWGGLVEYWWPGLALCLAVWWLYRDRSPGGLLVTLGAVYALGWVNGSQVAFWVVPVIALASRLELMLPRLRWAFYAFYPVHLVFLAVWKWAA